MPDELFIAISMAAIASRGVDRPLAVRRGEG
jgi:hypothetical protein